MKIITVQAHFISSTPVLYTNNKPLYLKILSSKNCNIFKKKEKFKFD